MVIALFLGACGGADAPTVETASTPEDEFSPSPLIAPPDCPAAAGELEIWTQGDLWATEEGNGLEPYEACLVVPADEPFTVTMHHVKAKGTSEIGRVDHNFSIYADSIALDRLFYGKPFGPGKDRTFEIPALPAGIYLFRCDIHPRMMKGILVAGSDAG